MTRSAPHSGPWGHQQDARALLADLREEGLLPVEEAASSKSFPTVSRLTDRHLVTSR